MPLTPDDKSKYKALYLQTAEPYVSQMHDILKAFENGNKDDKNLELIHRAAHSMGSQSEMMEFTSLGTISRLIEKIFKAKIEKTREVDHELLATLIQSVQKMQDSLKEIATNDKELDLSDEIALVQKAAQI